MNKPKYITKQMIQVNENLRVYKYFYRWGERVYYTPRDSSQETIVVDVLYPHPITDKDLSYWNARGVMPSKDDPKEWLTVS